MIKMYLNIFLVTLIFWVVPTNTVAEVDDYPRDKITAVYIFSLAEHIQWANEASISEYRIHLIEGRGQVNRWLKGIAEAKKLHGKSLRVTRSQGPEVPENVQLIFISRENIADYPIILQQVEGRNILLISESLDDQRKAMINLLENEKKQIQFEINKANILNQNLGINPDIILLGGTEIDVAKLYQQSQESLKTQEKRAFDLEQRRRELEFSLKQIRQQSRVLENKLKRQQTLLSDQQQKLKLQQTLIERKNLTIEQEQKKYEALSKAVSQREAALTAQEFEIAERVAILKEQDEKIELQQQVLKNQSATIANQRNFLIVLSVAITLVLLLVAVIYQEYRNKKFINIQLAEQKQFVEHAAEELASANQRLQDLDKLKSMFIASMSHELRTPLNSIIGFTSILLQGISGELNNQQRDNLNRVHRAGKHLLNLITDVIDISKLEAGHMEMFVEHFSLKEVIDEAVETIQPQADKKQLVIEVEATSWPMMYTDRKLLFQCLLNYLSNAVKYTEQGVVTLLVRELNDDVEIAVRDNGIGIAKTDIPKLFEAFERFESRLKIKAGGSGLGLYLTKKITTEILQGSVGVETEIDKGSTFFFKIPKEVVIETEQIEETIK